jgi:hypothetical protein
MGRRRGVAAALALVALCGLAGGLAGCASSGSSSAAGTRESASHDAPLAGAAMSGGKAAAPGQPVADVSIEPARLPSDVIRTADLELRVAHGRVAADVVRIDTLAGELGGYVSASQLGRDGQRTGSIEIRVPVRRFHTALADIANLGTLQTESITGQDVTQDFVDLGARLENLRAQQSFLRRLMSRAQTVSGSIDVENHLTSVELGMERLTGQIRYLQNRASFSTVTVTLSEQGAAPPVHHHASALWKAAARSLHSALSVVETVIVGAGYVVPLALLALIALGAGRLLWPRLRPLPGAEPGPSDG